MMDKDALRQEIASRPYWYHKIELADGVVTPGWAPLSPPHYGIPRDMTGMRVLDIGAWDGYWTFQALKRGAREVVAIDDFSDHINDARPIRERSWDNFDFCRNALGFDDTRCQRREFSVYDLSEAELGRFDAVFFFGVLYHLKFPFYALHKIADVCDGEVFVESSIADDYSPYRGGTGKGFGDAYVMEFYPDSQLSNNATGWWAPTLNCLGKMVLASGFHDATGWKLTDKPDHLALCRGFIHAWREGRRSPGAGFEATPIAD